MKEIIGIRFKPVGKIFYFDPLDMEFEYGDKVVVDTVRGLELGYCVIPKKNIEEEELKVPLKPVIRKASDEDEKLKKENEIKALEAAKIFKEKIKEYGLDMKLIDTEYTLDASKVIFFFTSETRVDFRELVKDLARIFRIRIELRQIGVRDEAKTIPSIGKCGRNTCCSSFMGEFCPVSIKMAKDQDLSLNGNKLSGACGRLMCCLNYEEEQYSKLSGKIPQIGAVVTTKKGRGVVVDRFILKQSVLIEFKDGEELGKTQLFFADEVKSTGKFDSSYMDSKKELSKDNDEDLSKIEG